MSTSLYYSARRRTPLTGVVHLDDLDVEWDEAEGYELPGMRDADLVAELGGC